MSDGPVPLTEENAVQSKESTLEEQADLPAQTAKGDEGAADSGKPPGKLQQLLAEYGSAALVTYLAIFGLSLGGFAVAISAGFEIEGAAGNTGLFVAAWAATKVIQPLRIAGTVVLTPLVAQVWQRFGRRGSASSEGPDAKP